MKGRLRFFPPLAFLVRWLAGGVLDVCAAGRGASKRKVVALVRLISEGRRGKEDEDWRRSYRAGKSWVEGGSLRIEEKS